MNIWFYPYTSPLVLTDNIFNMYGGELNASTDAVREKAYLFAEMKASEDLGTYFQNTTVTGTYQYSLRIPLKHNYVWSIDRVRFEDFEGNFYWSFNGTDNAYAALWNPTRGLLDLGWALANCRCHRGGYYYPYRVEVVYQTGMSSGTVHNSQIPLALTTYAQIILNEIEGFGNESSGDVRVTKFSDIEYSEVREGLVKTVYGDSPKANFAHKLLTSLRKHKWVGL